MKNLVLILTALGSLSAAASDYNCTVALTQKDASETVIKSLRLPVDGLGEMVSVPNEDILDVRLFNENGDLGVRLASMTGFPYTNAQPGTVTEQIRAESIFPAGTKKTKVSLQVPKTDGGANTYTFSCAQ